MLRISNLTGFGGQGDSVPPIITSASSVSVQENYHLSFTITTDEAATITIGGVDAAQVELASNTFATSHVLRWSSDGTRDYESPADVGGNNVYDVTLTPTNAYGTVGATQSLAITVTNIVTEDPNWPMVKFLTGYEGSNLSVVVTDESPSAHGTGTVSGSGTIVTAIKKFGASSFAFDGGTVIRWPHHADFDIAAQHFTLDTFVRFNTVSGVQFMIGVWPASSDLSWILYANNNQLAWNVSTDGSNNFNDLLGGSLSTATQYHARVDYDGTKYRLYLDGTMVASSSTARTIHNSSAAFVLGGNSDNGAFWLSGHLDETELTIGVARCGSDSGFTAPVAAYPRG